AGSKLGAGQSRLKVIVDRLRIGAIELFLNLEHAGKLVAQPQPGRRAPEQEEVVGESLPDSPVIGLHRRAVTARHSQVREGDSLAVQQTEYVVIGNDQEIGGCAEGGVWIGEERRIHMAVRAKNGQILDQRVQLACLLPLRRIGVKA